MTHRYRIFGYRLAMPFALPDFDQCLEHGSDGQPDVQLVMKSLPAIAADTSWTNGNLEFSIKANVFELTHPVLGRVVVQGGSKIFLEPGTEKYARLIRTLLSNTLMPVIALQRGHLPLHSSIVDIAGCVTAFIGESGAGKSTLAAQLHAQGNAIVTEDIGVVELDEQQRAIVRPGIPYFRLWQDSMEHLEIDPDDHPRVWKNRSKHHIPMVQSGDQKREVLQRIYLLEDSDTGQIQISRMKGFEAVQVLVTAVPFNVLQHSHGLYREFFEKSVSLTRQVQCYRLQRPRDFSQSDQLLETLNQHISEYPEIREQL